MNTVFIRSKTLASAVLSQSQQQIRKNHSFSFFTKQALDHLITKDLKTPSTLNWQLNQFVFLSAPDRKKIITDSLASPLAKEVNKSVSSKASPASAKPSPAVSASSPSGATHPVLRPSQASVFGSK